MQEMGWRCKGSVWEGWEMAQFFLRGDGGGCQFGVGGGGREDGIVEGAVFIRAKAGPLGPSPCRRRQCQSLPFTHYGS